MEGINEKEDAKRQVTIAKKALAKIERSL